VPRGEDGRVLPRPGVPRAGYARALRGAAPALLLCCLSCTLHKVQEDAPPPISLPERFAEAESGEPSPLFWWEAFQDPELDRLEKKALTANFDLRQAWDRLEQADALARQAGAAQWPSLDFQAGAGRSRSAVAGGRLGGAVEVDQIALSVGAAYEVDVWKRIASLKRGAVLDREAARQDLDAAAMTLSARVAAAWFTFLEEGAQLELLLEQQNTGRTFLELTLLRFSTGLSSALDVYQQRQQLAATRAQVPLAQARREVARHQLAVLTGETSLPELGLEPSPLADLPPLPALGLPADLLQRRPDIRRAQLRLAAADHRVAAAVADRFPALRIGGDTGFESYDFGDIGNIFSNWVWSLMANLTWPVFDGGRRKAEVDRTRAVVRERLDAYGQAVLVAVQEVQDALVQERRQKEFLDEVEGQVTLAGATLREARMRYLNGLSDYLPVLAALQSLQELERGRLTARRNLLSFRVELYRAMGGAWPAELEDPAARGASQETPEGVP